MKRTLIAKNQIWRNRINGIQLIVCGKANDSYRWKTKVLTEKPDVFAGSHTMSQYSLWKKFELVQ